MSSRLWSGAPLVVSSVLYQLSTWLVILLIARVSGATSVGQYSFAISVTTPIYVFLSFQLRNLLALAKLDRALPRRIWEARAIAMILGIAVSCVVGYLAGGDTSTLGATFALAITRSIEGLSDLAHGFMQRHAELSWIAVSFLLRGTANTFAAAIALLAGGSLLVVCCWVAGGSLLVLLTFDIPRLRRLRWRQVPSGTTDQGFRAIAALGLPLGGVSLLANSSTSIPRIWLFETHGSATLGEFSLLYYIVVAVGLSADFIGQAFQRHLLDSRLRPERLRSVLALVHGVFLLTIALVVAFGSPLVIATFQFIYGKAFAADPVTVRVVLIASLVTGMSRLIRYPLTAAGIVYGQLWVAVGGLAASVLCCALFIATYGPLAVAGALLLQGGFEYVSQLVLLVRQRENRTSLLAGANE